MENIEVIAEFRLDSTIRILKILFKNNVYEFSYKLLCQWKENDWIHILSICDNKKKLFELTFDCDMDWKILKFEELD